MLIARPSRHTPAPPQSRTIDLGNVAKPPPKRVRSTSAGAAQVRSAQARAKRIPSTCSDHPQRGRAAILASDRKGGQYAQPFMSIAVARQPALPFPRYSLFIIILLARPPPPTTTALGLTITAVCVAATWACPLLFASRRPEPTRGPARRALPSSLVVHITTAAAIPGPRKSARCAPNVSTLLTRPT